MQENSQYIYFISDIHLVETRPDLTALFQAFINSIIGKAQALYILGDFFATWTGQDTQTLFFNEIMDILKYLQTSGTKLFFMPGNRDFLLEASLLKHCGINYLTDPTVLPLKEDTTVLLLHGDRLCTLDIAYQWYRRFVQHPWAKCLFLKLPRKWRQEIAHTLRNSSQKNTPKKPAAYQDVDPKTVQAFFEKYQPSWMIHGHVHRPAIHGKRLVLGDWGARGSVIRWNGNHFERYSFPETSDS